MRAQVCGTTKVSRRQKHPPPASSMRCEIDAKVNEGNMLSAFGTSSAFVKELKTISGKVRPAPFKGHEHFGYNDGISQPAIDGIDKAPKGQDTIEQGVILCNRGSNAGRHPDWMTDGSFMCFRKLEQNVPAWNKFLVDASNTLGTWSDQLGARLIGRWKSGEYALLSFPSPWIAADLTV